MKPLLYFSLFQTFCILSIALTILAIGIPWSNEKFTDLSINFHLNLALGISIPLAFVWLIAKKKELTDDTKKIILLVSLGYMAHSTLSGYFTGLFAIPLAYYSYILLRKNQFHS